MLPGKALTITDILQMVRRRIWLISVPPTVFLFAALVYSSTLPKLYQSDMLIAIDPQRVPDSFVRTTVTMDIDRRLDAITVQVLSRTNLEQMIEALDLYPAEREAMPMDDVVQRMRNSIAVNLVFPAPRWGAPNTPTSFHVRFTYPDPDVAARVAQQLGQLFVEQNVRDRGALARATNRFLDEQLTDARRKLEDQERRLEAFRQRHGPELPTQLQTNLQAIQSRQMQAQALVESMARDQDRRQMLERLHREAAREPATPVVPTPAQAASGAGLVPGGSARQQLEAARETLAGLELRYTPEHPDVARVRRMVADLEPKAAAEEAAAAGEGPSTAGTVAVSPADAPRRESLRQMAAEIESLDRQIAFKEAEERRLRAEIDTYQRRIEAVPGLESEFTALTRDYDTHQAAYRELLSKSSAAQVAENLEDQDIGERFRVVDPARVPVHPLATKRRQYNAGGLLLGLLLGVGLAAFLELRDSSYRSETDVLEVLALPVLASVPAIETAEERVWRHRKTAAFAVVGMASAAGMGYVAWTLKLWNSLL